MAAVVTLTMNPTIDVSTVTERVRPTEKLRCEPPSLDAGGGGINVARVIRRLGGAVEAVFPAGGPTGVLLRRLVEREGVSARVVPIEGLTRENVTVGERATGEQFRFVLPGPELSEPEWEACLDAIAALGRPRYLVASGSLPPGVPEDFYGRVAEVAHRMPARFVLDTSGPALHTALEAGVWMIKPNREEFERLAPGPGPIEERARRLIEEGGVEVVVLSLGRDGALVVDRKGSRRHRPPEVEVVSAVGAGDSLVGALVHGLVSGRPLDDAVCYGIAAGTAALATPGTELARPEDVERLYRRMCGDPDS